MLGTTGGNPSIESVQPGPIHHPGEPGIDPAEFRDLGELGDLHVHEHGAEPYMPMSRSDFLATDLSVASLAEIVNYRRMKTRIVRDRNESPEAREYYDRIQAAYEESFETITPEMLADPAKMNMVRCVDPYSDNQLDELNFAPDEQVKIPGGLTWFEVTGTMHEWVVPRIFNEQLAAGVHRNCGGLAIIGCLTGERQVVMRNKSIENAMRIVAETAASVQQTYLRSMRSKTDPEVAEVLSTFGGPKLIFPIGQVGTAEDFVTPKAPHLTAIEERFTPREIVNNVENWVDERMRSKAVE